MTHPTHPWTPCPPRNPHCNETQPPEPNTPNVTVDISNYVPLLILLAFILIVRYYKYKK